jgi:RNA polymerase sigma-70 factor (ECF subfamily)
VASSAFDTFYRQHYGLILRFAERRIDIERAQDVAAECFAIAWKKFDADNPPPLPWLYQTARFLLANAYRKKKRDETLVERLTNEARSVESAAEIDLLQALGELRPAHREVLMLTYWEDLDAASISQVVGCSEQAAWKRISRAKNELKRVWAARDATSDREVRHG